MTADRPDHSADDAAWRAIVADICTGIPVRYPIGERVPTYRAMAARHGVSLTPVRTAYAALKRVGILESQAGRAVWVARAPAPTDAIDGPSLAAQVQALTARVDTLSDIVERMLAELPGWPPAG